jgi:alpha-glucosidase (family GH31 glycosyl hydrolase)
MAILILVVLLAVFLYFYVIFPLWGVPFNAQRHGNPPLVPAWALECWLWEDDYITEDALLEHLNGYLDNDLPVRTYLIDCPWATRYNDFTFDETRFPHYRELLDGLQKRGLRVALWMSTMVNSKSDDCAVKDAGEWFADAARKGYLVGGDYQWRWWLGKGGFIDYTNPDAMNWWHGLQDQVLDLGVDAWKLDDTASFFTSRPLGALAFYQKTHAGWMTTREYMDHFYRDEYKYALAKNPEFVTMSRPIDSVLPWGHPEGFSPIDASPINWVGDNTHTWAYETRGIERAIRCILDSAKLGYNIIGSDTGGYHGEKIIPADLYVRWAEFSSFCGFFLNGGHGERRLWMRTPKELELIREYSWLHTELVPYMYCSVVEAHNGGKRLMRPMREGKYQYGFGDWLLVAPIYTPSEEREVTLPEGAWRYWFDDAKTICGGTTFTRSYPLDEYPVFVRDGAIIPMNISREYTGLGARNWEGLLTLNIYPAGDTSFAVPHTDGSGVINVSVHDGTPTTVTLEGAAKPHILRVLSMNKPKSVERNGALLVEGNDWRYLVERNRLIVRSDVAINGKYVITY